MSQALGRRRRTGHRAVWELTEKLDFNVTRCGYAEFYKELGLAELGYLFHCNRDFAMVEGFSGEIARLERTQTIMEAPAIATSASAARTERLQRTSSAGAGSRSAYSRVMVPT